MLTHLISPHARVVPSSAVTIPTRAGSPLSVSPVPVPGSLSGATLTAPCPRPPPRHAYRGVCLHIREPRGAGPPLRPIGRPMPLPGDVTGRGALPTLSLGGRSAGGGTGLVNNDSSPLGSRLVGAGTSHPKHGLDSHVQMARRQSPRFILHLILHFLSDSVDLQETCHVHDQSTDCAVVQE